MTNDNPIDDRPAFGQLEIQENMVRHCGGLSERKLFAAMAMQGICANPSFRSFTSQRIVAIATERAGALIKELDGM